MTEPAHENHIEIPAQYKTVTRTEKVADGYLEWQKSGRMPTQIGSP